MNYSRQTLEQMMGATPWLLSQVLVKPWLELHPPVAWGHSHFYNSSVPLLEPLNFYTHILLGLAAVPLFGLETWCLAATLRNHLLPFQLGKVLHLHSYILFTCISPIGKGSLRAGTYTPPVFDQPRGWMDSCLPASPPFPSMNIVQNGLRTEDRDLACLLFFP